jgi:hypothetical protein
VEYCAAEIRFPAHAEWESIVPLKGAQMEPGTSSHHHHLSLTSLDVLEVGAFRESEIQAIIWIILLLVTEFLGRVRQTQRELAVQLLIFAQKVGRFVTQLWPSRNGAPPRLVPRHLLAQSFTLVEPLECPMRQDVLTLLQMMA